LADGRARANRLYLKPAARPLLDRLSDLGADMMETVLDGISPTSIERMLKELGAVKNNLHSAIARSARTNSKQPLDKS
jgi:MarR family transcriptional regulator, transcriptional regulator for hemolysin